MRRAVAAMGLASQILLATPAAAYGLAVTNVSATIDNQSEAAIAVDPNDPANIVVVSNTSEPGLFMGVSHDGGTTWARRVFAHGPAFGTACCDPTISWDDQGNLFLAWLDESDVGALPVALSTNAGDSWSLLAELHPPSPTRRLVTTPRAAGQQEGEDVGHGGFIDQPTVVAGEGMVWLVWNNGAIQAAGARVFGPGDVGAFHRAQDVPRTSGCSFGDIAIGPLGQVMQVCSRDRYRDHRYLRTVIRTNVDPDGLGPAGFGRSFVASATNVRQFEPIRPQRQRTVDTEAGLAWDRSGGPLAGRLYLVYTGEFPNGSDRTDIWVRVSDDDGVTWSAPVRANDDPMIRRSQFLPRIAIDQVSGMVAVGFHDARLDDGLGGLGDTDGLINDDAMYYLTFSADGGATFGTNIQVAEGASNAEAARNGVDYGDYTGLAFVAGVAYPVWADNSNSTGDNPNGTLSRFDVYTAPVPSG